MQYILTEEEYNSLIDKKKESVRLSKEKLQKLCTKISNEMPIERGQSPDQPWGCILTDEYHEYCDNCPVTEICPNQYKHWSK